MNFFSSQSSQGQYGSNAFFGRKSESSTCNEEICGMCSGRYILQSRWLPNSQHSKLSQSRCNASQLDRANTPPSLGSGHCQTDHFKSAGLVSQLN